MSFDELINSVRVALAGEKRIAYRVLKRRFELSDDDLEDIKADLIDAKRLAGDEDGKVMVWLGEDGGHSGTSAPALATPDEPDRRLLTVMFCDIVGSTELSARFDAEELREIIREYQTLCAAIIEAREGHVAQYLGDGLLVYFGYPLALEHEASRCVQAALEILDALARHELFSARLGEPLRVRIGIHTGPVVIGEMGGANRPERLALGETPNIAARVQSVARPNEILVTAATHRLVTGLYDCELHGPYSLKGVAESVELFTVVGEGAAINRFEVALSTGNLSKFVGRGEELTVLEGRWEKVKQGESRVVLLSGDPGMGKSRLVQEFKRRVGESARHMTLRCSPNHQQSAYYPFLQFIKQAFSIENRDNPEEQLKKVQAGLAEYQFANDETAALYALLLGLPAPNASGVESYAPEARKSLLYETAAQWMHEEAARGPVVLFLDDLHWMDQASSDLLASVVSQIGNAGVLTILAFRSDYSVIWDHAGRFDQLAVAQLPAADVETMIEQVAAPHEVPASLVEYIKDKTDGIPLYVEELTQSILESGVLDSSSSTTIKDIAVPETLQDSLEARIDRCPNGKSIAQWGAVIGREFSHDLLVSVVDDRALVSQGIDELLEAELIYRSGSPTDLRYIFKHALLRDTAYESLLIKHRRAYHAAIVDVLEKNFSEIVEREPEVIANHLVEAGIHQRAIDHLYVASERAIENSAGKLAQNHLRHALEILPTITDTKERAQTELRLLLLLGPLVSASRGNASGEVEDIYKRALALCDTAKDAHARFAAYFGLRAFYLARSDLASAHDMGLALHRTATHGNDKGLLLEANVALSSSYFFKGEFARVIEHAEQGLDVYDETAHAGHAFIYGLEPGCICMIRYAMVMWMRGDLARAGSMQSAALSRVESLGHALTQAFVYANASTAASWQSNHLEVLRLCKAALNLAEEFDVTFLRGWSLIQQGHAKVMSGQQEGMSDIERAYEILDGDAFDTPLRSQLMYSWFTTLTAEAYGELGKAERGLALLPEAIALIEKTQSRYSEAQLFRVRGELLAQLNLKTEARESIARSLDISLSTNARSFALQAATALVELEGQSQGVSDEARATLRSTLDWFPAGVRNYDLDRARQLLNNTE